jgi:signal transduction histidine kinase
MESTIQTPIESNTRLHGRWFLVARVAWITAFIMLTVMYAFGFLAVHQALSTVCEEKLCTLRLQIRHTEAGEQVMDWGGPPEGYADPLRPDQVKVLEPLGLTLDQYGWLGALQLGIPALMYLLIAAGLFWWKSDDWMVLFISTMVMTLPFVDMPLPYTVLVRQPIWQWIFIPADFVAVSSFFIFPLVFPTGRFVPRWTRWKLFSDIAFAIIGTLIRDSILIPPLGWSTFGFPYIILSFVINAYAQSYRYFRVASPVERQQIKWVVVGVVGFISIAFPVDRFLYYHPIIIDSARALVLSTIPDTIYRVITLFIPVSIAISVMRYRLWDIDIILSRTLVYGILSAGIVVTYILLVGALSVLSQTTGNLLISLLATGLIAFLFQPLRERLQGSVNRLLYGDRDDPYAALSRLGRRLESTITPEAVLPTVVTTVREALKLPYTAIYLKLQDDEHKIIAESASTSLRVENGKICVPGMEREGQCIPLIHQGETLGYLVLGPRTPNEAFSSSDLRLVDDLAPQVGVAVHAMRLTSDLQRSREQLVLTREEERRRLRRDLHDDLGPTLASLGLTASTAAILIPTDPNVAIKMVNELESQIRATVGNVRRLVYDLRPPTLDELGLLAAVRERADRYSNAPNGFHVSVDAPAELPALLAAVEVAAYRIVQEALANISKHAQARQCTIRFTHHTGLQIEITDDGIGLPRTITPGVGLRSLRERAEELGGSCLIERRAEGGTRVLARLPIGEFNGSATNLDH